MTRREAAEAAITEARRALVSSTTEADLRQAVVEYAALRGWRCHHGFDQRNGFPDFVAVRDTRMVVAELLGTSEVIEANAVAWIHAAAAVAGVETYVWRPLHWGDGTIEDVLR